MPGQDTAERPAHLLSSRRQLLIASLLACVASNAVARHAGAEGELPPASAETAEQAGAAGASAPETPGPVRSSPAGAAAEPPPAPDPAAPIEGNISPLELQKLALVNGARLSRGIPALEWNPLMAEVARAHATEMMRRGVISHTGADGSSPQQRMRRAGVTFRFGSENIWSYWKGVQHEGPSWMHAQMMAEPHIPGVWNHIGAILYRGYRQIGIGIAVSPTGVQYLSELFAD